MAHYVNNEKFVQELVKYKKLLKTDPTERVPEYIGQCILDICTRFASRPNFYGYSYRDEMVSDGVENCLQYLTNFDPEKSTNAFAYYTQIAYFAFIRRISKEKKQAYIKHRLIIDMPFDSFDTNNGDDDSITQGFINYVQSNSSFDYKSFEDGMNKKAPVPRKKRLTPLEEFIEEYEE